MVKHSVKDALKEIHTNHADFCAKAAKSISTMGACMEKMSGDSEIGAQYAAMSASAKELSTCFLDAGEIAAASAKELDSEPSYKVDGADDLSKRIVPDGVARIPTTVRPIIREGQRELTAVGAPEMFQKLYGDDANL